MLGHRPGGGLVDQVAVLDGADAGPDGPHHRLGDIGVGEGVRPPGGGLTDGGADLLLGVLDHVDGVGRRGHATSGHHLDLVGAALELLPGGAADGVDPVGDVREARGAYRADPDVGVVAGRGDVTVASGLGQHSPRPEHPRAGDQTGPQRLLDAGVETAGVAHGGEATAQHPLEHGLGLDPNAGGGPASHRGEVHRGDGGVDVGVDEPGHERAPPGVDHLRVVAGGEGSAVLDDLGDAVSHHPHRGAGAALAGSRVEKLGVGDEELGRGRAHRDPDLPIPRRGSHPPIRGSA